MKLTKLQLKKLHSLVEDKYIRIQEHPKFPLFIANYTHNCQMEKKWNELTMMCRGLIFTEDGTIIARPFKKFFNIGEGYEPNKPAPPLPDEPYSVYEKMDGSLGILYWWEGKPYIATRGSFTSNQAIYGQSILDTHLDHEQGNFITALSEFEKSGITPLWEIIFPENRIVVDYGNKNQLVLIGLVEKKNGKQFPIGETEYDWMGTLVLGEPGPVGYEREEYVCSCVDVVKEYGDHGKGISMDDMCEPRDNAEGYVLFYPESDLRVKLKHEEYCRLHKLITGINDRRIWEILAAGDSIEPMMESVPDEFYQYVKGVSDDLRKKYVTIEKDAQRHVAKAQKKKDRAKQAKIIKKCKHPGVGFAMLDGKDYGKAIWGSIKPKCDV